MKKTEDGEMVEYSFKDIVRDWKVRVREWFFNLAAVIAWMDVVNFFRFKKDFDEEEADDRTDYHRFHLRRNKLKNIIYCQWNFTDTDLMYADYDSNKMCMRKFSEIAKYISKLGWGEYINPDAQNFIDEKGDATLSYAYIFEFTPKAFSFGWLFKWIGIILGSSALIAGIIMCYYFLLVG